jgi:hypothetical protein
MRNEMGQVAGYRYRYWPGTLAIEVYLFSHLEAISHWINFLFRLLHPVRIPKLQQTSSFHL